MLVCMLVCVRPVGLTYASEPYLQHSNADMDLPNTDRVPVPCYLVAMGACKHNPQLQQKHMDGTRHNLRHPRTGGMPVMVHASDHQRCLTPWTMASYNPGTHAAMALHALHASTAMGQHSSQWGRLLATAWFTPAHADVGCLLPSVPSGAPS